MAFLRFSRDKHGYEHFYLLESMGRAHNSRTQILYWFRSPPAVRVGRSPFSDSIKRALEERYPGVVFNWRQIETTSIPPPAADVEPWRERRKAERAAKQAARAEAEANAAAAEAPAASELEGETPGAMESAAKDERLRAAGPPETGRAGARRRRRRRDGSKKV
ncbi:MAG: hypothetical protein IT176_07355 [Acidobacteria bacterium]|nr:hypothetical protein [Acidobacteriota bacterium]